MAESVWTMYLLEDKFRRACLMRGAEGDGEISELLGVHRSTVYRVTNRTFQVGSGMFAAMVRVFGPLEAVSMIEVVPYQHAA